MKDRALLSAVALALFGHWGRCQPPGGPLADRPKPPARAATLPAEPVPLDGFMAIPLRFLAASEFVALFTGGAPTTPEGKAMVMDWPQLDVGRPPFRLPPGAEAIAAYAPLNAALVRGTPESVRLLAELARKVDRPRMSIELRFRLLAVPLGQAEALFASAAEANVGRAVAAWAATNETLRPLDHERVSTLGAPQLTTMQGCPASTTVGDGRKFTVSATPIVLPDRRVVLRLELESGEQTAQAAAQIPKAWADETATVLRTAVVLSPGETAVVLGALADKAGNPMLVPVPCPDDPGRCLVWLAEGEVLTRQADQRREE